MYCIPFLLILLNLLILTCAYQNDLTFKVEAGSETCFFEEGATEQLMEAQYQVIDGQHGDLDISFKVKDPNGTIIISDYKRQHNAIIRELNETGDYEFCFDNTYSLMNYKLVFLYLLIEDKPLYTKFVEETPIKQENGEEQELVERLKWSGMDDNGDTYFVDVDDIIAHMNRVLKNVVSARGNFDMYRAHKARDTHMGFENTFLVDVWSMFQISVMLGVGLVQVYMIKQLFERSEPQYRPYQ